MICTCPPLGPTHIQCIYIYTYVNILDCNLVSMLKGYVGWPGPFLGWSCPRSVLVVVLPPVLGWFGHPLRGCWICPWILFLPHPSVLHSKGPWTYLWTFIQPSTSVRTSWFSCGLWPQVGSSLIAPLRLSAWVILLLQLLTSPNWLQLLGPYPLLSLPLLLQY